MTEGPVPPPNQAFREPWHAQLFAITIALHEDGVMSWPEWTGMLAEEIEGRTQEPGSDPEDEYYRSWQAALERLLQGHNLIDRSELKAILDERKTDVPTLLERTRSNHTG